MADLSRWAQHAVSTAASTSIGTGARATIDLTYYVGGYVDVRSTGVYRTRSASAQASLPTAGSMSADMPRSANLLERFYVSRDTGWLAVFADSGATFYWSNNPDAELPAVPSTALLEDGASDPLTLDDPSNDYLVTD